MWKKENKKKVKKQKQKKKIKTKIKLQSDRYRIKTHPLWLTSLWRFFHQPSSNVYLLVGSRDQTVISNVNNSGSAFQSCGETKILKKIKMKITFRYDSFFFSFYEKQQINASKISISHTKTFGRMLRLHLAPLFWKQEHYFLILYNSNE